MDCERLQPQLRGAADSRAPRSATASGAGASTRPGLALFAAASAACALAPEHRRADRRACRPGRRRGARCCTLGAGSRELGFPPERRGAAIGLFSAVTGLSVASGPLVGGAVIEGIAWEWIFWLNVPLGLIAVPLALTRMRRELRARTPPSTSAALVLVSAGAFASSGGSCAPTRPAGAASRSSASLVAGATLVAAFVALERRRREPMLPIRFFRSRAFSAGNAAIFFTFASLFTGVFFFAQLLQTVPRLRAARRRAATDSVDGHVHHPSRQSPARSRPLRRATVHGRRVCSSRPSGSPGSL